MRVLCFALAAILSACISPIAAIGNDHDYEVVHSCQYTVQPGDTMTKIANYLEAYLPLTSKDCIKCSGVGAGKEACAVPASQCAKCGHKGNYVELWRANGACKNGFNNVDKLKVGQLLMVPNCEPLLAPTPRPTRPPSRMPTRTPTYRIRRPTSPPSTDDAISGFVKGAKKILDGVQSGVNDYKARTTPTAPPTPARTRKPSPRPYRSRKKPKVTDDYYPAGATAYAAEA